MSSAPSLCVGVAKQILEFRGVQWDKRWDSALPLLLDGGGCVYLFIQTTHVVCDSKCQQAIPVEIWKIGCEQIEPSLSSSGVDTLFVHSAVCSHLYFSPLNAWISSKGLPSGISLSARLELQDSPNSFVSPSSIMEHTFPSSRVVDGLRCTVSVRYVQGQEIPYPEKDCTAEMRIIADDNDNSNSNSPLGSPIDSVVFPLNEMGTIPSAINSSQWMLTPPPTQHKEQPKQLFVSTNTNDMEQSVSPHPFLPSRPSHLSLSPLLSPDEQPATKVRAVENENEIGRPVAARRIIFGDTRQRKTPEDEPDSAFPSLTTLLLSENRRTRDADRQRHHSARENRMFSKIGLPTHSSPAPPKDGERRRIRNSNSLCVSGTLPVPISPTDRHRERSGSGGMAMSAPSRSLLCNFEESALHSRLDPLAEVDGFRLQLAASSIDFCSPHISLPVRTFFFDNDDDTTPAPFMGVCSLESLGRRGLIIPKKGTLQATLFNPQGTVVRMFVQMYDLVDMPPKHQTFIRQRTFFMRDSADKQSVDETERKWLRYLVHFKFCTDRRNRLRLHTDIRMLFSQNNTLDAMNMETEGCSSSDSKFELHSFTETPRAPMYSPV